MKKKVLLSIMVFVLAMLTFSICAWMYWWQKPYPYYPAKQYAAQFGLSNFPCSYAELLTVYGEPKSMRKREDTPALGFYADYDGVTFCCSVNVLLHAQEKWGEVPIEEYEITEAMIHREGTKYRFGRYKIGIGSKRSDVERAYRRAPLCYEVEGKGDGYIETPYYLYVRFLYDENDLVDQMTLTLE